MASIRSFRDNATYRTTKSGDVLIYTAYSNTPMRFVLGISHRCSGPAVALNDQNLEKDNWWYTYGQRQEIHHREGGPVVD